MITFDATATYSAEVLTVTVNADGSAVVRVRNRDPRSNIISEIDLTIQADHAASTLHERTGETGIAASADLGDAITAAISGAKTLLSAVIAADKHAL